jgi:hypothetical protein
MFPYLGKRKKKISGAAIIIFAEYGEYGNFAI